MRQLNKLFVLLTLVFVLLTGRGGPPLAQPEEAVLQQAETPVAATQEATSEPTAEVTATTEATTEATPTTEPTAEATTAPTEEPTAETPPPTGEATSEPTSEPTIEPTLTEEPTSAPTVEPTTTLTATTVESTPALTPTAAIAKEGSVTVGKYTFSLPQGVPGDFGPSPEIMGWLPDSPDEIVDTSNDQVISINMYSGQTRKFSEVLASKPALSLLKNDQIAYATDNSQTQGINIWVSGAEEKQAKVPLAQMTHLALMTTPDGKNLFLYNIDSQEIKIINEDSTIHNGSSNLSSVLAPLTTLQETGEDGSTQIRHLWLSSASNPASRWTAVYNSKHFALVDLVTDETQEINLVGPDTLIHVESATWSPDGQQLALLVTDGEPPIPFMKLFILEVETGKLQEFATDFQYVTNVTWAPDNQNLLISAITGAVLDAEGEVDYETSELFLINIPSKKIEVIPILPKDTAIGFIWQLSWSPDGRKIALSGYLPGVNQALARIDVTSP